MAEFHALLRALLSTDNAARAQAEQALEAVRAENPSMLLQCLGQSVRSAEDGVVRSTAAVLLRRYAAELLRNPATSDNAKALVQASLLGSIQEEQDRSIRRKVADTTGSVAFVVMNSGSGQWPELIPFLVQYCQSATACHRESVISILGNLSEWLGGTLAGHADVLKAVFTTGLTDGSDGLVRLAALRATCKFLPSLPDHAHFNGLLAPMVQVVSTALEAGDENCARGALEELIGLVDINIKFMRERINDVCEMMRQICASEALDEGTRHLAMEFLVSVAEKSPGLSRKIQLANNVVPMCLQFMLTISEDESWEHIDDADQDEDEDTYTVGEDALYRVSMAIGGNAVLPVLQSILGDFVENQDWRYRLAALTSLCQTTEGCSKRLSANLAEVVQLVLARFTDPHPRVRHAALNTLGTMASDFGPALQDQFHGPVMQGLAALMEEPHARVQAHAAAALCNFCEVGDEHSRENRAEVIAPYLDGVLSKLQTLMSSTRKIVLDNAIVAVAAVASVVESKFAPYYDMFMPFLKQVVATATTDEMRMLRAKAIECISLVGLAVGKDKFAADAHVVMQMMAGTQMKSDDPQAEYIVNAWPRICKCLGAGFVPYLEFVMPTLIESAAKKPDVALQDADKGEMEGMQNLQIGDKIIGIRTSDMEEKKNASMAIARFVEYLQEHFYPYIEKTATIMIPLLKFYYHDDVRMAGAFAMPELVKCCFKYNEANGGGHAITTQLSQVIYTNLVQCIPDEPQVEVQVAMMEALQETIEASAQCLGADQAPAFLDMVPKVWQELQERQAEQQAAGANEDCDEEEWAAIQESNAANDEVHEWIGHCFGAFFKAHKDAFLPFFQQSGLPEQLLAMLTSASDIHRKAAMWVWTDMVDNCPSSALVLIDRIVPPLLNYADMGRPATVRTAAAYGLGVCAAKLGEAIVPFCGEIVTKFLELVNHAEARVDENEDATDNVVSALGKVCLHLSHATNLQQVLPVWVNYLPLKADLEEAAVCHEQLCKLLEKHPDVLLNTNNQMVQVANVMSHGLKEELHPTAAVATKMQQYLQGLKQQIQEHSVACAN